MKNNGWSRQPSYETPEFTETEDLFLKEKSTKILICLSGEPDYGSNINKKVDTTYAHAVNVLQKLDQYGLAETEKEGRKKIYSLTEEGQKIAEALKQVVDAGDGENKQ